VEYLGQIVGKEGESVDPKHVLGTVTIDDITRLYKFDNFGSSYFPSVFVAHSDDLRKL
jgi:hypothetical protein